ncbi:MAG TPA: hypothetical protein VG895_04595 [Patescibacteria group bacterium]|nr:hypothetical protein [Patescibacteria group bacterium]
MNLLAQAQSGTGGTTGEQTINLQPQAGLVPSVSGITISSLLGGAINLILVAAALIFFIMLVIGGVQWILSGGDKGQTEAARGRITAALIGLVIVFAAWAIASLVGSLFGINIFSLQITPISSFK